MIEPTFDFPDYRQRMTAKRIWREMNDLGREYERVMGKPFDAVAVCVLMGWETPKAPKKAKAPVAQAAKDSEAPAVEV